MELQPMPIEHSSNGQHHSDPPDIAPQPLEQQNPNNDNGIVEEPDMVPKQK